jgi:DNA-binding LacI/PurR family transcriptional regulator
VVVDEPCERGPGGASDARGAGRLAAEHLLGLGHCRIAFVGPATDVHTFRMRERGFVARLREEGIALPSAWLRRAQPSIAAGQAAMRALLGMKDGRPTAVFCANDLLALGALKACLAAGVRVPAEMSLVGCDDIELARVVTPELTTVAVPARELGARAARILLRRLEKPSEPHRPQKPLPVRLAVRGTTARPQPETER